jgi:hypothetical protein
VAVSQREKGEADGEAVPAQEEGDTQVGEDGKQASKQWYDIMSKAQGAEVERVCRRLMPRDLYKMVFVAE